MRVLIVTHEFPPRANPRAFRWGALVEHWSRCGWQIDVICGPDGSADALQGRGPGLRVFAVGGSWLYALRRRVARGGVPQAAAARAGRGDASGAPSTAKSDTSIEVPAADGDAFRRRLKHLARGMLGWVYDRTWAQVRWPDYAWYWYAAALRQASALLRQASYDALVTVSNPFTGHCVGLELKRRFPAVRWLADVGDPLSFGDTAPANNRLLYGRRNQRLERAVLSRADAVSMVARSMIDAYVQRLGVDPCRLHVVPPLLSAPSSAAEPDTARPPHRALVYAGMLYRRLRNPRWLLHIFRRLLNEPGMHDLRLHFFGNAADCQREFAPYADLLGRQVFVHGLVGRDVVWQALRGCHAVVHLGEPIEYGFPSKLLEYAHLQRPILSLQMRVPDRAEAFLREYGAALCLAYGELQCDPSAFARLVRFVQCPPRPDPHRVGRLLAPHRLDAVAAAYEALLAGGASAALRLAS